MARKTTNEDSVEIAERTLAELQAKREALAAARASDEADTGAIAYAANTGDERAAAKLETLQARAIKHDVEARNLDSAIAEARRRVAAAQEAEAAAETKQSAEQARVVVERIDELFASADIHFKQAMDALEAAEARIEEVHRLGFTYPTAVQLRANIIFALQTCMVRLPKYMWDELARGGLRYPSPAQRRTFSQFWSQMSASLGREIASRLGEKQDAA